MQAPADSVFNDSLKSVLLVDTNAMNGAESTDPSPISYGSPIQLDSILWQKIDSASLARYYENKKNFRNSIFKGHPYRPEIIKEPNIKSIPNNFTLAFSLVFTLGILSVSRYFDRLKFENFLWGAFYRKEFEKFLREDNLSFIPPHFIWFLLACFTNGLFLSQFDALKFEFNNRYEQLLQILSLSGLTAAVYLIKSTIIYIVGNIFKEQESASIYNLILFYAFIIMSFAEYVILIYKIISDVFNNEILLYSLAAIVVATTLYLLIRLLLTLSIKDIVHILYLILYLCTLEILPLIVLGFAILN
jgi:hypothetical protein